MHAWLDLACVFTSHEGWALDALTQESYQRLPQSQAVPSSLPAAHLVLWEKHSCWLLQKHSGVLWWGSHPLKPIHSFCRAFQLCEWLPSSSLSQLHAIDKA